MRKKIIKILLLVTSIICVGVLVSILSKGVDPFESLLFGLFNGLWIGFLIAYLIHSKREAELHIDSDNISEYFDDLENRIDLAEEFVLNSQDKGLKKEWEQIRQWDKSDWEINWTARKRSN